MPRIVVTSPSFSRNPTLRRELLERYPGARFREGETVLSGQALIDHIGDAEAAIVGLELITEDLLAAVPQLKLVAKYGVGLDNIDRAACERRGVAIGWTGGLNARSVAEMALCFMLGLSHNIFHTANLMRQGTWLKRGGVLLSGHTVGIIGIGNVGREVVRLLSPLGCRILGNDIEDRAEFYREYDVIQVDKETLYAEADLVSLHVPLTPQTHHLMNTATLAQLKRGAFLLNTSRGKVVDQEALRTALLSGHLGGAALDVYELEPPTDLAFLNHPTLIATPHIGGNAEEAVLAMGRSAIHHMDAFWAEQSTGRKPTNEVR
ncbi:MAG: phosphoglycerate dehydrogenase [Betaproteobacteria bacterium]